MNDKKIKLKDMTPEQRAEYHRNWRSKHKQEVSGDIVRLEIHNCPKDLKEAIMSFIKEGK